MYTALGALLVPSPFHPAMDPWLEHPSLWPNVHQSVITYARDQLQGAVSERYFVGIGERVYVEAPGQGRDVPDVLVTERRPRTDEPSAGAAVADQPLVVVVAAVERREPFLEITDAHTGHRVVTVVEVLSPANKRPGPGRDLYLRKQLEVLASPANLVEIDLLRAGESTVALPRESVPGTAYRVVVSRARDRERREAYPFRVGDRVPRIGVPLAAPDADAVLDLPRVLAEAYDKGGYARRVEYAREASPPLAPAEVAWTKERLSAR